MNNRQLACEIANHLFTNGAGGHAKRLVLEMPNLKEGGGWCETVVADLIEDHLNAQQGVQADALSEEQKMVAALNKNVAALEAAGKFQRR